MPVGQAWVSLFYPEYVGKMQHASSPIMKKVYKTESYLVAKGRQAVVYLFDVLTGCFRLREFYPVEMGKIADTGEELS